MMTPPAIQDLVALTLRETAALQTDLVTGVLLDPHAISLGTFTFSSPVNVGGLQLAAETFRQADPSLVWTPHVTDGRRIAKHQTVATVHGPLSSILAVSGVASCFIARLSGIMSHTKSFVNAVAHTHTRILMPHDGSLWHAAHVQTIQTAGAVARPASPNAETLIRTSHVPSGASLATAVERVREAASPLQKVSVEVDSLAKLTAVLPASPDAIFLLSTDPGMVQEAVQLVNMQSLLGAVGNVSVQHAQQLAETGIDMLVVSSLLQAALPTEPVFQITGLDA